MLHGNSAKIYWFAEPPVEPLQERFGTSSNEDREN